MQTLIITINNFNDENKIHEISSKFKLDLKLNIENSSKIKFIFVNKNRIKKIKGVAKLYKFVICICESFHSLIAKQIEVELPN